MENFLSVSEVEKLDKKEVVIKQTFWSLNVDVALILHYFSTSEACKIFSDGRVHLFWLFEMFFDIRAFKRTNSGRHTMRRNDFKAF